MSKEISRNGFLKLLAFGGIGIFVSKLIPESETYQVIDECTSRVVKSRLPNLVKADGVTIPTKNGDSIIFLQDMNNQKDKDHELGHAVEICEKKKGFASYLLDYFKDPDVHEMYADRQAKIKAWHQKSR